VIDSTKARGLIGSTAYDSEGNKLGRIGQIYLDDRTSEPEWMTVATGLFGTKETFVPLASATVEDSDVRVPYSKDQVKDAPNVDTSAEGHLSPEDEERLYAHYGMSYGSDDDVAYGTEEPGAVGRDVSGPTTDDAMTRSEQRLRTGTERVETGRARLRKWVETEQVEVPVTVQREKARLETEPITDANRDDALSGPELSEEEHEVTLTEERPVVAKETVPVERARLTKDVEADTETVREEVARERIAAEGDVAGDIDLTRDQDRDRI